MNHKRYLFRCLCDDICDLTVQRSSLIRSHTNLADDTVANVRDLDRHLLDTWEALADCVA